jgi:protein gp37
MRRAVKVLANFLGATKELTGQYAELAKITDDEQNQIRLSLTSRPDRKTSALLLAAKGLSTRQIADLTGWNHATIARDLQPVANATKSVADATPSPEAATNRPLTQKRKRKEYFTLDEWDKLHPDAQLTILSADIASNEGLNKQTNADIEWADWSWNPITGCLHGCPYCYARDIAFNIYPAEVGFGATLWPKRLLAPIDRQPLGEGAAKNIFVCSMADLFGRWVPARWIETVLKTVEASPQWNFLFLTKFPKRMSEFEIPTNAWMGTTVDLQARVANAEKAFEKVKAPIKWLSIEPMSEPITFFRLDLFDWVVIGGASESKATDGTPATPDWNPPIEWMVSLHQQARQAGCKIYYKTNSGLSDMSRIREFPGSEAPAKKAPAVFDYLRSIPKQEQVG